MLLRPSCEDSVLIFVRRSDNRVHSARCARAVRSAIIGGRDAHDARRHERHNNRQIGLAFDFRFKNGRSDHVSLEAGRVMWHSQGRLLPPAPLYRTREELDILQEWIDVVGNE